MQFYKRETSKNYSNKKQIISFYRLVSKEKRLVYKGDNGSVLNFDYCDVYKTINICPNLKANT